MRIWVPCHIWSPATDHLSLPCSPYEVERASGVVSNEVCPGDGRTREMCPDIDVHPPGRLYPHRGPRGDADASSGKTTAQRVRLIGVSGSDAVSLWQVLRRGCARSVSRFPSWGGSAKTSVDIDVSMIPRGGRARVEVGRGPREVRIECWKTIAGVKRRRRGQENLHMRPLVVDLEGRSARNHHVGTVWTVLERKRWCGWFFERRG